MRINYGILEQIWHAETNDFDDPAEKFRAEGMAKASYIKSCIDDRLKKYKEKKELIDTLTYENVLIKEDIIGCIREDLEESSYNIFMGLSEALTKAWIYFHHKEENKEFKGIFELVLDYIKRNLIPDKYADKVELVDVVNFCFSAGYEFTFMLDDLEFIILVPVFGNANKDNYLYILNGYCLNFKESKHITNMIFNTLDPREFKKKLGEWINEKIHTVDKT